MKGKKYIIIGVIVLLLVCGGIFLVSYYKNTNNLTIVEKNFIDEASGTNKVLNINVLNNAYIFGYNGEGIYYDFLDEFAGKYGLSLNEMTYSYGNAVSGVTLGAKTTLDKNDIVLYTDHYVLVSKNHDTILDSSSLAGKTINVLNSDLSYVSSFIGVGNINYTSADNADSLFNKVNEGEYAILPLHLYLGSILSKELNIVYHFSDINMYYTLTPEKKDTFSNILVKYYNEWSKEFDTYYNKHLFDNLCTVLNLSETEVAAMQARTYKYGFINNSPYEVISNGNYGGIAAVYLKKFMDLTDVEFKFTKYNDYNKLKKAINQGDVDIYFSYYQSEDKFNKTSDGILMQYSIIANRKNPIVINSIYALVGKEVYVEKNSVLETYLKSINGIDVKTYDNSKDIKRFNNKDVIIFVDTNVYNYYHLNGLKNYTERYNNYISNYYTFNTSDSTAVFKLLNKYTQVVDSKTLINEGVYNNYKTTKSGVIFGTIAKYFIAILLVGIVFGYFIIKKTRKVTIAKKINKADTVKFIDQLTLLKNRNYLKENIDKWNNNTIYPQTIMVIDLNHVQSINDIEGYEEGDKQIKAASNILIKTQLDNSDIIRTDGNEFLVYLVGYSQKQITNYMHKLNKEFKKLPYNYGAEFGYSMIIDDIKTIEDALNEATKTVKEQKGKDEKKD